MAGAPFWRLRNEGTEPAMLEAVVWEVRIRTKAAGRMKCWALNVVGKRMQHVPLTIGSDGVVVNMQPDYKTVYYEISAE